MDIEDLRLHLKEIINKINLGESNKVLDINLAQKTKRNVSIKQINTSKPTLLINIQTSTQDYYTGIGTPTADTNNKKEVIRLLEPYTDEATFKKAWDKFDKPITSTGGGAQDIKIDINYQDIETVIYEYAGVKKEDMEIEFREWLKEQTTNQGGSYNVGQLVANLKTTIPSWDGVEHENIFNILDIETIFALHQRCGIHGDLHHLSIAVGRGQPMLALLKYKQFLKQRQNNDVALTNNEQNEEYKKIPIKIPLNQILYGPPGTGKTYETVNKALKALKATDEQKQQIEKIKTETKKDRISIRDLKTVFGTQVEFVTFHQSFSYEDFVEGLKAKTDDDKNLIYDIENGVFKEICNHAKDNLHNSETSIQNKVNIEPLLNDFASYIDEQLNSETKFILPKRQMVFGVTPILKKF